MVKTKENMTVLIYHYDYQHVHIHGWLHIPNIQLQCMQFFSPAKDKTRTYHVVGACVACSLFLKHLKFSYIQ